jgi:hypothetical protein
LKPDDVIPIRELLRDAGFVTSTAQKRAREVLESASLTRAGKSGIARYKRDDALALLARKLVRVCGDRCAALANDGRSPVRTASEACELCGGSNNRRSGLTAARILAENGVRAVLIVGGRRQQHREIEALFAPAGVSVEWVDGTRDSSQREANAAMRRAQLLIIWGSTQLRHAVSNLYTADPPRGLRSITVARRGIEALCDEITRSYERAPARRRR